MRKCINNYRADMFISFIKGGYLYINASLGRFWRVKGWNTDKVDIYMDDERIRLVPNELGEYTLSPQGNGWIVSIYAYRDCGIKSGIKYPVEVGSTYVQLKYAE